MSEPLVNDERMHLANGLDFDCPDHKGPILAVCRECAKREIRRAYRIGARDARTDAEHAADLAHDDYLYRVRSQPTIVCLCGSTKFMDAYREATKRETLAGKIVVSIGLNLRTDTLPDDVDEAETKVMLDALHKRKIDLADEVLILNVDGYIGDSTRSELEYALAHADGKRVGFLHPELAPEYYGAMARTAMHEGGE